ncbi:ribonuclease BN [Halalkalicoccus jeotgali B3]|uniref:Ribonuclease BN n=2 Tax=Halalkalicoccus jeotgali TaxID=413810 RepID=D8J736_HALJB|nr:ribonuclease BN [Halalkalicoccus jeotgali B3]ELY38085.1 ribonuclease BN [Halalkalicoccus jeotgali B3]
MRGGYEVLVEIVREVRRQNLPFLAGSLAFYAFVSLLPLLLLVLVAASLLAGETVARYLLALTRLYLSPTGQDLLAGAITEATGWVGSSIVGLLVLLWAAFRMFLAIDTAFAQLYETPRTKTSLGQRVRDGLIASSAIVLVLVAAVATAGVFTLLPDFSYSGAVDSLLLVCGLLVAFLPLYYVFPNVEVTLVEVLPGALFAAVGWALLQWLFQFYASVATLAAVFGVIGGALLFLLWLYFGALIILFGVVVNVVLAGRTG